MSAVTIRIQQLRARLGAHRSGVLVALAGGVVLLAVACVAGGFSSWVHTEERSGEVHGGVVELCEAGAAAGAECLGELGTPMLDVLPGDSATRQFAVRNNGDVALGGLSLEVDATCTAGAGCVEADVTANASVTVEHCTAVTSGACTGTWEATALTEATLDTLPGGSGGASFAAAGPAEGDLALYRMTVAWSEAFPETLAGSTVDLGWRVIGAVRAGETGR